MCFHCSKSQKERHRPNKTNGITDGPNRYNRVDHVGGRNIPTYHKATCIYDGREIGDWITTCESNKGTNNSYYDVINRYN